MRFQDYYVIYAVTSLSQGLNLTCDTVSHLDSKRAGEEIAKRRKTSSAKLEPESSTASDELFMASPCLVNMGPGVRITTVAAGGRHTLALSGNNMGSGASKSPYGYDFWDGYLFPCGYTI